MRYWLAALWRQLLGHVAPDPWQTDPKIVAARERQHELGITDSATARRIEADFWRERVDREQRQYGHP